MAASRTGSEADNYLHQLLESADCDNQKEVEEQLVKYCRQRSWKENIKDLNSRNSFGNTPLLEFLDCMEPRNSIVQRLVEFGADVNLADSLGRTPLHKIVSMQFIPDRLSEGQYLGEKEKMIVDHQFDNERKIMTHLLMGGASCNQRDIFGRTPLFLTNDIRVIRSLVRCGGDLTATDNLGRSLLHAVSSLPNYMQLIQFYLSELKRDSSFINKQDNNGSTLAHYAAVLRRNELLQLLKQLGADLAIKDARGHTPLDISKRRQVLQYTKHYVHYNDIINADDLSSFLPTQATDLAQVVLRQQGIGAPFDECESEVITDSVLKLVLKLSDSFQSFDPRLKCSLLRTGSSSEGTKTGDPNEFDFVFCLDNFESICKVKETDKEGGFVELEAKDDIPDEYKSFFNKDHKLDITAVRLAFANILKCFIFNRETWCFPEIVFSEILHLQEYSRPVFTLKVRWIGCLYKDEEISLDFVPAVRFKGWWPSGTNTDPIDMINDDIRKEGLLFLVQNLDDRLNTFLTVSAAPAEICLMKSLPPFLRESYRLCKVLRHKSVCPLMDPDPTEDTFPLFEADLCIKSYMLKNSLFHILNECKKDGLMDESDKIIYSRRGDESKEQVSNKTIKVTKRMLRFFYSCTLSERLPVYMFASRDIFMFEFIDNEESEANKLNSFHCKCRRAFVKILLHLLSL